MSIRTLIVITTFSPLLLYLVLAAIAFVKRTVQERLGHWLALYLLVSALWELGQALSRLDGLPPSLAALLPQVVLYGLLLLALQFLYLTRTFLRYAEHGRRWSFLAAGWLVLLFFLDLNPFRLSDEWHLLGRILPRVDIAKGVLVLGWAVFMGITAVFIYQSLSKIRHQPLHRNRIQYWILVLGITALGDIIVFSGQAAVGSLIRLVGTMLATYAMLIYNLFDIRRIMRRTASYSLTILITALLYVAGFSLWPNIVQSMPAFNPLLLGVVLALFLAVIFEPILTVSQRLIEWLTSDVYYNPSHILRDYSSRISNIVDINQLETTALSFISEVLEISHSTFYLVDAVAMSEEQTVYQLYSVHGMGEEKLILGSFDVESVVADFMVKENRPLAHYDIDLLPHFRVISVEEREWLDSLGVEVFVPIHAKGRWLGLLGLGPKVSGDRYFENDLLLLGTLADQTAVALENARLFADLVRLNREIQEAYAALSRANSQLQESDKLKSAFIGVITHEMRTPFANVIFSLQLLERYGLDNLTAEQREEIEQVAKGVDKAKSMVDNLVSFAGFLNRQGELRREEVDFIEVVKSAVMTLRPLAENKGLSLHLPETADPVIFSADLDRLADAIHHLVHNAIKFTEEGEVRIHLGRDKTFVHFAVSDTGVGIPEDRLAGLWDGFSQMADPLKRGVEGLGLGLALVKHIVEAHGGKVKAKSTEGQGSTFGFSIPTDTPMPSELPIMERLQAEVG
jgi:signal transduction histidine kinase